MEKLMQEYGVVCWHLEELSRRKAQLQAQIAQVKQQAVRTEKPIDKKEIENDTAGTITENSRP